MLLGAILLSALSLATVNGFHYEVREGDPCFFDKGQSGKCISFYDCEATYKGFLKGHGPEKYCFYNGIKLLVCCPTGKVNRGCGETNNTENNTTQVAKPTTNPSKDNLTSPAGASISINPVPTVKPTGNDNKNTADDISKKWGPGFFVVNGPSSKPTTTTAAPLEAKQHSAGQSSDTGIPPRPIFVPVQNPRPFPTFPTESTTATPAGPASSSTQSLADILKNEFGIDLDAEPAKPISFDPIGEADAILQNKTSLPIYLRKCYEFGAGRCKSKTQLDKEGYVEISVVGGSKAAAGEFPFMVAIGYDGRERGTLWLCGGSLISDRFVLTAAHCTSSSAYGNAIMARAGDLNIKRTDDDAKPQDRRIVERVKHPFYRRPAEYHDIAVLRVDSPFAFDKYVYPACLSNRADNDEYYNEITAIGWGREDWANDEGSADLQKVVINLVNQEECNKTFIEGTTDDRLPWGIVERWQVCAGSVGKDTCQGDSGGPLLTGFREFKCMPEVLGVTSIGKLCGSGVPGIYTRTYNYLPWIESVVWPDG